MADLHRTIDRSINISRSVADVLQRRTRTANERFGERLRNAGTAWRNASTPPKTPMEFWRQWSEYNVDLAQRSALYWDTLRQRGNQWLEHEAAGKPPVLTYKYEMIADAREYERPANHALVRIIPPKGIVVDDAKRPFVIVDPRAGHGPGIGGSKEDSEVGVALSAGHPVYFVIFFPDPCPGHVRLRGIDPKRVVRYFAEVPSFAVQIDRRIDLVQGLLNVQQVVLKAEAHQIKAESIHLIFLGPNFERIEHEFEEHAMLRGRIRTASVHVNIAIVIEPVIITRHHFIEN